MPLTYKASGIKGEYRVYKRDEYLGTVKKKASRWHVLYMGKWRAYSYLTRTAAAKHLERVASKRKGAR